MHTDNENCICIYMERVFASRAVDLEMTTVRTDFCITGAAEASLMIMLSLQRPEVVVRRKQRADGGGR